MWTTFLFAWGGGHDDHVRFVFKYMPEDIASFWHDGQKDKIIKVWSHFPDGSAFSEEESALIGQEDMAYLKNVTPGRYPFHSSSGKAAAFFMLAKSFRDKNPEKAALFMGALMHSMADASAFNHGDSNRITMDGNLRSVIDSTDILYTSLYSFSDETVPGP